MSSRHSRNLSASLYIRGFSEKVRQHQPTKSKQETYDDVKRLFGRFGHIVDITLPLDYYSREPKGYGFVEFKEIRDAHDARRELDRTRFLGRELEVELARGDRKTPSEMRAREKESRHSRRGRSRSRDRRNRSGSPPSRDRRGGTRSRTRSPSRSPYSRSPIARRPPSRSHSKSASPDHKRNSAIGNRRTSPSRSPTDH